MSRKANSADTFTMKTEPLARGDHIVIHHISVCNNTSDTKVAHVGFIRDEFAIYVKTLALTSKTYFYKVKLDVDIPSGYRIIVKAITPTSGDMYYVSVFGYIEDYVKE